METNSSFETFEMQITETAKGFLKSAAGWGMFLSIVGFVCIAFGLLGSLAIMTAGDAFKAMPGAAGLMSAISLGVTMLVFIILLFFPVFYLFKFATTTKQAVLENNTQGITKAFGNLKSYFLWSGILTIIWIVSYIGFVGIFAASVASARGI
ncbi:hypothetical protein R1T16_01045 [Flavobacterium sp. DG1-102-2]|uniref:hypothetical protein n=1 Tax=Flavobacterium sp. DG1-102-2 TaxID=3081663 RepID=UPI002949A1FA|nr:hypothetical protein [Flavobacterium sp. DG1-102-2]MDV6166992.1 hypothetical protein [Flavobacterium sp. DG1-102-2]